MKNMIFGLAIVALVVGLTVLFRWLAGPYRHYMLPPEPPPGFPRRRSGKSDALKGMQEEVAA